MKTVKKNVFYCSFCSKHGLSRAAMEKHERHCTLNSMRTCRWKSAAWDGEDHPIIDLSALIGEVQALTPLTEESLSWLRVQVNGCPACMLAVLRQSGVEYHYALNSGPLFDYQGEVERFREEERFSWEEQERRDIESTFL
jgi:hypothetical protein